MKKKVQLLQMNECKILENKTKITKQYKNLIIKNNPHFFIVGPEDTFHVLKTEYLKVI